MAVLAGQCLRSAPSREPRVMSSVLSHVFVCVRGRMGHDYVWSVCAYPPL